MPNRLLPVEQRRKITTDVHRIWNKVGPERTFAENMRVSILAHWQAWQKVR